MSVKNRHEPLLHLAGVGKFYGDKEVLKNIHLRIYHGEFVAVVGRSGCGKSTLLRVMAGLASIQEGKIFVRGRELKERNKLAKIMFQDGRLLPWKNVAENVGLGLKKESQREKIASLLEQVGLREHAGKWPSELSGGQQQRVALARALIHEPELLLLDEPLGALDALTRLEMQDLIENLWRKKRPGAVLVTHDVEEAVALATRVILIENGTIAMDLPVNLPYPRQRDSAVFRKLEKQILNRIFNKPDEPVYIGRDEGNFRQREVAGNIGRV